MKKILVSISMGMSVRNLLYLDFLNDLSCSYKVILATPFYDDKNLLDVLKQNNNNIEVVPLYVPKYKSRLSRWFYNLNYIGHWFECKPIQIKKHIEKMRKNGRVIFHLYALLSFLYMKLIKRSKNFDVFRDLFFYIDLEEIYGAYDELFVASTDQNIDQIYAYSASRKGKRVHALVHSWDNLTSRGFLITRDVHLLVWNEKMKNDASIFQKLKIDDVDVIGVPQFEIYNILNAGKAKVDLQKYLQVGTNCKIVTFCCSAERVFPDEEILVEWLVNNLSRCVGMDTILVLRLHPDARQLFYIQKYSLTSNVRISTPDLNFKAKYITQLSSKKGLEDFSLLMKFSDVVINLASTTALDAICSGTPAIGINFNMSKVESWAMAHRHYLESSHYDEIIKYGAIPLANSKEDLIEIIQEVLSQSPFRITEREKLKAAFNPHDNSKERLIDAIKS